MKALNDLKIFIETAKQHSLSAAARNMDITPAAASAALKRLESEVGALLFIRSTRNLRLTQQGEQFLNYCEQAVGLMTEACSTITEGQAEFRGVIKLSMPSDCGRNIFLGWIDEFMAQHPKLEVRVQLSDGLADMYTQPVDIALRYGEPSDSSLVALPIAGGNTRILCASPGYLAEYGTPLTSEELATHNCLCFALGDSLYNRWRFFQRGQEVTLVVKGNRYASDGEAVRRWALAGKGIAYKSLLDVKEDLVAGRLMGVDIGLEPEPAPLYLVCASRRVINPQIQALKEFLADKAKHYLAS
ncbi:LysR family transcriptional regulator [Photobacterium gaetbulicola]|uniref:LysR family transcriptional regulator n=1 Tax=Photobacterium gaetbulicola Gung47 TaxID=658445 RepID=A0A0C5WEK0_9GAMM|nr:LysR family transcriptional regulator [Photobacterium gaetbulicola]AJR05548.1 LysR family transcriptional regulator [Photobacterium gaetbulicola Gung47]PSU14534.1 LysR family transcriptional regulator [Photobacterium gaetbulicola]